MTDVVIDPRLEDVTSDVESIMSGAFMRIRPSKSYFSGGQWVLSEWPDAMTPITGTAITAKLDPLPTIPYELEVYRTNSSAADNLIIHEYRIVPSSGSPVNWGSLTQTDGPIPSGTVSTTTQAALDAMAAQIAAITGGASTLAGISDMSAFMRTVNDDTSASAARTTLGAAPIDAPSFTTSLAAAGTASLTNLSVSGTTSFAAGAIAQAAVNGLSTSFAGKADLAGPTFTGDPKAPTPTAGDADTSIATTAFVDTSFAKKASPTFTGTPAAPTPTAGTNTTQIATTAFVKAEPISLAQVPAGYIHFQTCPGGVQPVRPTARTDIIVAWMMVAVPSQSAGYAITGDLHVRVAT